MRRPDAILDPMLDAPAATLPSYAADGRLYCLSDATGSAQVWEVRPDGAAAARTAHRDAVAFVAGSPVDGGAIFGRDAAGDERIQLYRLPPAGVAQALTAAPKVMHGWGAFAPDGSAVAITANARDPAHADPVILPLDGGPMRRLREVQGPHELAAWHPDGGSVLLAAAPRAFESLLHRVDIATGASTPATPGGEGWRHQAPRWRRDGEGFWLLTDRGREFLGVAWMAPGSTPRFLHAPEADVERLEVSPDGDRLAVVVNLGGWSQLRLLDAATGQVVAEPRHPPGVIQKLTWRPDGGAVAFDLLQPTRPGTIWRAEAGQAAARLLFAAGAAPAGAQGWAATSFPTHDGRDIPAFLIQPEGPRPAGGWPALIWVHGGPEMQALPNWRPDLQAIAALGIAVLVPNIRGSTGYGRAYAALDDRELRTDAVRDVAAAQAWLARQPEVDAAGIAVMGQSYGGWMVLMAVTHYPDLWAAAVEYYGIARWKTFFERTGPWRIGHRAAEYGDPVRDAELLESLSPLHKAAAIRCPLFVAQGMTDPRVPPQESEQIVAALRARDIPVEYLTFPDEGHGFLKRDNRRAAYRRVLAFLARHLLRPSDDRR
ncbi:S9 family peptidase [Plastoroseomonas hellenica]|uniref:S9 family peptidase n=1 Tax=Plastoroseomonas hellenica TaxID=2687306 RepID=UPI001BAA9236|nr:S9 family peptidase [Plastoroseomonas hellenica]MBR0646714.1 S9 family peptidase [Plastoroseomonas hellenica]